MHVLHSSIKRHHVGATLYSPRLLIVKRLKEWYCQDRTCYTGHAGPVTATQYCPLRIRNTVKWWNLLFVIYIKMICCKRIHAALSGFEYSMLKLQSLKAVHS